MAARRSGRPQASLACFAVASEAEAAAIPWACALESSPRAPILRGSGSRPLARSFRRWQLLLVAVIDLRESLPSRHAPQISSPPSKPCRPLAAACLAPCLATVGRSLARMPSGVGSQNRPLSAPPTQPRRKLNTQARYSSTLGCPVTVRCSSIRRKRLASRFASWAGCCSCSPSKMRCRRLRGWNPGMATPV